MLGRVKGLMNLRSVDRIVSLTMAFSLGFCLGTTYQEFPVFYWVTLVLICAVAKVELYHRIRRQDRLGAKTSKNNR